MDDHIPKVSVVVPSYNRGYIITKCLQSICEQSFTDIEIIVVDDGSSDNTETVVNDFKDPRIRYVKHPQNRGLAAALNTGFREARASFVACLPTDDLWIYRDKLKEEYQLLAGSSEKIGAVYSGGIKEVISGEKVIIPPPGLDEKQGYLYETMLQTNIVLLQATLIKKTAIDAVGGMDENLSRMQDWDFFIRFSKKFELLYLPHVTTEVPISPDSNTKDQRKRLLARTMIFEKHRSEFALRPRMYVSHSYAIGHGWALRGDMVRGRRYLWSAFFYNPSLFNLKYFAALALALLDSQKLYAAISRLYAKAVHPISISRVKCS